MSSRDVAIVGAAALPVGRALPCSIRDAIVAVALDAIADSGLDRDAVDGLFVGPPSLTGPPAPLHSCAIAHQLGLTTRAQATIECGGMSAALAFKSALEAIRADRCRAALVIALDKRVEPDPDLNVLLKTGTFALFGLYGPFDGLHRLRAPIPFYAMSAQRYLHEHGLSREDLARLCVTLRSHAALHPRAMHRKPLTIDEALSSRPICPPLSLCDCSSLASGAAAVVLARADAAPPSRSRKVFVTGVGEHHEPDHFLPARGPLTTFKSATVAANEAYRVAGRAAADIDVAEVYGAFSATELMLYEDLGFFAKGEAPRAVREGMTSGGGRTFFSPSGGRLSFGHPACATPLLAIVELTEQLRGTARGRQVERADVALAHAEHGMVNGSVVFVLEGE